MKNLRKECYQNPNDFLPLLWNELFADDHYTKANLKKAGFKTNQKTAPAINISTQENRYLIEVVAAGFDKSDFNIEYDNNKLTISAQIKEKEKQKKEAYSYKEFARTAFERTFVVKEKEVDIENIGAKYEAGVLYVSLPKQEKESTKKKINIV